MSVEAARDAILAAAEPVGTERVPVADALGRVTAEAADRTGLASALAEFGDGRLRDHRSRHVRRRGREPRSGSRSSAMSGPGWHRTSSSAIGLPPGSQRARVCPTAPMRWFRSRPRHLSTPRVRPARAAGMRQALSRRRVSSMRWSRPAAPSGRAAVTCPTGAVLLPSGMGITAAAITLMAGAGRRGHPGPSTAARRRPRDRR